MNYKNLSRIAISKKVQDSESVDFSQDVDLVGYDSLDEGTASLKEVKAVVESVAGFAPHEKKLESKILFKEVTACDIESLQDVYKVYNSVVSKFKMETLPGVKVMFSSWYSEARGHFFAVIRVFVND